MSAEVFNSDRQHQINWEQTIQVGFLAKTCEFMLSTGPTHCSVNMLYWTAHLHLCSLLSPRIPVEGHPTGSNPNLHSTA